MPAWARLIVAALLALAIPVQALSAVVAGICMAADHHPVEAASQNDDHADHGHGDSASAAPHQHDDGTAASDSHCPPCVACCAAAAIAPSTPNLVPDRPAVGPIVTAPYAAAGFQPDGLDRPPLAL